MTRIKQNPKREKKLDKYKLPPRFMAIFAKELARDQFFFYHMTGQRLLATEVSHGILSTITAVNSSGRTTRRTVLPDKVLIVYRYPLSHC